MKTTGTTNAICAAVLVLLSGTNLLLPSQASAQGDDVEDFFRITPYIWMLSLDGTTASFGADQDVDASFSDILDNLNIGLMVNLRWQMQSGWFFELDPMWASLELDLATPGPLPITGKAEVDMWLVDAIGGYKFNNNFGVYGGARYYDQDIEITFDLGAGQPQGLGDDWTDFIIGVHAYGELGEKWTVSGKLDAAVGGDSDSAYYAQFAFNRRFGQSMLLNLGWRYYDVDYVSGSGLTLFKWDVAHSGPAIGWSWLF